MARCNCSNQTCSCVIIPGDGVTLTGNGTSTRPYQIGLEASVPLVDQLDVADTSTLNLSVVGTGQPGNKMIISGVATQSLRTLADINDPNPPANGEVPTWVNDHWEFLPQTAASSLPVFAWGTVPLDDFGPITNSAYGQAIYLDQIGNLRAQPTVIDSTVALTNADTLTKYPIGPSVYRLTAAQATAGGWPVSGADALVVTEVGSNGLWAIQRYARMGTTQATLDTRWRVYNGGWQPWQRSVAAADTPVNGDVPVWVTDHWEFSPPAAAGVPVAAAWGFSDPTGALPDLDNYGSDSTIGSPVYLDSAGKLRATPMVIPPAAAKTQADGTATYPMGTSVMTLTTPAATSGGWPYASSATVVTHRRQNDADSVAVADQWWFRNSNTDQDVWFRHGTSSGWGAWQIVFPHGGGPELGANVDLDTLTRPGVYIQSQNSEATLALHYPVAQAGLLEVFSNQPGNQGAGTAEHWQRYTVYSDTISNSYPCFVFLRGYYSITGAWSAWRAIGGDTGWIDGGSGSSIFVPSATNYTLTSSWVRRQGDRVSVALFGTSKVTINMGTTTGDHTNTLIGQMAAPYRPADGPNQGLGSGYTGRMEQYAVYAPSGEIYAVAGTPGTNVAAGDPLTISGTYLL